jgi:excisionase family DNA binding protein
MEEWGGDAVMTLEDAAGFLKVSETTVYQLLRDGQLKARKVGREWRFLKSALVAYLKEGADFSDGKVMLDDINGGEYRIEDGQENVALWLPVTRDQKKALISIVQKKDTTVTEVVMNALRGFARDWF